MDYKRYLLILAVALICGFYLAGAITVSWGPMINDFTNFYASAENFRNGESLYSPVAIDRYGQMPANWGLIDPETALHPNLNAPITTLLFLPFTLFPLRSAYIIWVIISLMLCLSSSRLISKELGKRTHQGVDPWLITLILLLYFPTMITLWLGQISFLLLLLTILSWIAFHQGQNKVAGILLGLMFSIKLFMGVFLILSLAQRRWKLLSWMIITFVATSGLGLVIFGWAETSAYLATLSSIDYYASSWNASFFGYFTRILGGSLNKPLIDWPNLAYFLSYCLALLSLGALGWLAWRYPQGQKSQDDPLFSLALVIMLLASPLGWMYYFPMLIIPAITIWVSHPSSHLNHWKILVIVAWIFSSYPQLPHLFIPMQKMTGIDILIRCGIYTYALLLLFWILVGISTKFSGKPNGEKP
jgi:hypothetical protein